MADTRGLKRAEFAVAAFGVTAFLLALLFVLDTVRFHGAVTARFVATGPAWLGWRRAGAFLEPA